MSLRAVVNIILLGYSCTSCVNFVHPRGDWAEPVDLNLHATSLSGMKIQVRCEDASNNTQQNSSACEQLGKILSSIGANVTNQTTELESNPATQLPSNPDFLLVYKDLEQTTDSCGWMLVPFIASFTLAPCTAESNVKATLSLTRLKDGRNSTWPLDLTVRRYSGLGALALMALDSTKKLPRRVYHDQLAHNYTQFVRNKVFTALMVQGGVE